MCGGGVGGGGLCGGGGGWGGLCGGGLCGGGGGGGGLCGGGGGGVGCVGVCCVGWVVLGCRDSVGVRERGRRRRGGGGVCVYERVWCIGEVCI